MLRKTEIPLELLVCEGNRFYLENDNPSVVQLEVLSGDDKIIKFGKKIELVNGDVVIITKLLKGKILISISKFCFGIFDEYYFRLINLSEVDKEEGVIFKDELPSEKKEFEMVKLNIETLKEKGA